VTGASADRVAGDGPNLASEIVDEQPAATVVACADSGRAVTLQRAFSTRYFRP
jgi:glycerol-3-phosphate dehydrogenase (NAD(P)+)